MRNLWRETTPRSTKGYEASSPTVAPANVGFVTQGGPLSLLAPLYRCDPFLRNPIRAPRPVAWRFDRRADRQLAREFAWTLPRKRQIPQHSADYGVCALPTYLRDPEVGA
jgi:hypothetical protein